ncbi:hypothetical protein ACIPY6_28430 [Streptomyces sp. NPDC090054]|uniref:hypothetical protein n=1 Tax=Streptomyces sp. NPDC090054 TaxID=3365933 RepID=UPI0038054653
MSDIIAGDPAPTNPADTLYPVTEAAELLLRLTGYEYSPLACLAERALRGGTKAGEIPCRRIDGRLAFIHCELQLDSTLTAFASWLRIASADEARERLDAEKAAGRRQADAWNARYPVGTPVVAYPGVRPEDPVAVSYRRAVDEGRTFRSESDPTGRLETVTRSVAWPLGHGEPVVLVEGYSGGIVLDHIDVIEPEHLAAQRSVDAQFPIVAAFVAERGDSRG